MAMHISRMENRTVSPISCPLFFRAISWLNDKYQKCLCRRWWEGLAGNGRIFEDIVPLPVFEMPACLVL